MLGENPAAVVRVNEKLYGKITPKDIQDFCAQTLAGFKVPVYVEIRKDPLPTNANGKILKREMQDEVYANALKAGYDDGNGKAKL